ncbi:MAG: AAA family ATPase [bacterium]|nr:AAA family ATPase [bacterium]
MTGSAEPEEDVLLIGMLEAEIPRAAASIHSQFWQQPDGYRPRATAQGTRAVSHALVCEAMLDAVSSGASVQLPDAGPVFAPFESSWAIHDPDIAQARTLDDDLLTAYGSALTLPALTRCMDFYGSSDHVKFAPAVSECHKRVVEFCGSLAEGPLESSPRNHAMFAYHLRRCLSFLESWVRHVAEYRKEPADRVSQELATAAQSIKDFSVLRLQYVVAMNAASDGAYDDQLQLAYLAALLDRYDRYENDVLLEHAITTALAGLLTVSGAPRVVPVFRTSEIQVACSTFEALVVLSKCRFVRSGSDLADVALRSTLEWAIATKRTEPVSPTWLAEPWRGRGEPEAWVHAIIMRFLVAFLSLTDTACQRRLLVAMDADSSTPKLAWDRILDHEGFKSDVEELIIEPAKQLSATGRPLSRAGMVLFGPPGTAKTSIARAIAAEIGWPLVSVAPHHFAQDGPDQVIRRATDIFGRLENLSEVVVLFDEIDELVVDRDAEPEKFGRFITTAMLPFLQDLHDKGRVLFIATTNHYKKLDSAIRRPGRFDLVLPVGPPDPEHYGPLLALTLKSSSVAASRPEIGEMLTAAVTNSGWHATIGELLDLADSVATDHNIREAEADELERLIDGWVEASAGSALISEEIFEKFREDSESYRRPKAKRQ